MSEALNVRHLGGDRFAIDIRGHTVTVDQPADMGGEDTAPSPTELFIAGLASCIAFYARRYLRRHQIPEDGLAVATAYELTTRPARVSQVEVRITPPAALPADRREAFLAVASHCTVHNSLEQAPSVTIAIDEPASAP